MENWHLIELIILGVYILLVTITKFVYKKINIYKTILYSIFFLIFISIIFIITMRIIHRNEPYQGLIYFFYALEANAYYTFICIIFLIFHKIFKKN